MKKYVIAIDLGGTNIKAAVVKDCRKILKRVSLPTSDYPTKGALISGMAAMTLDLLKKAGLKKGDVAGIGMGAPGLIDSRNGIIHHLVNIRGFNEVYVASLLKRRTGLDVFLDNDVNVMTLGELYYGAGRGAKNMLCLTLGTGVGGGIVIDGRLYRGSGLAAGEIGHMPLNESGPVCNCGGFGCMEKAVGNKHIVEAALRKIRSGEKSVITGMVKGDFKKVTPEIISRAAKKGDRVAAAVWREIGAHLGVTLAGAVNLLNPDRIVIGGGVAKAGELLFGPLRRTIRQRAMRIPAGQAKVVRAKLGQDAGLIGAAVLVRLNK